MSQMLTHQCMRTDLNVCCLHSCSNSLNTKYCSTAVCVYTDLNCVYYNYIQTTRVVVCVKVNIQFISKLVIALYFRMERTVYIKLVNEVI